MRRSLLSMLIAVLILTGTTQAQSTIPDGVFVRESNGTTWLVVRGQRVGVPVWQATDAEIAAIPASDQWAVLSVTDDGAMVAGSRPAWLTTTTPVASPVSVAVDPAALHVDVVQVITYRNGTSTFVQGFIQNTGGGPAGSEIAVSLLDASGATVGVSSAESGLHLIPPGVRAPFSAQIQNAPDFKDVRVQAQAKTPSSFERFAQQWRVDGVTTIAAMNPSTWAKLTGQVVNTGAIPATLVRITAAIYDGAGGLLEVRSGFATLNEIAPGQSSPFEIGFIGGRQLKELPRYDLWVEGRAK